MARVFKIDKCPIASIVMKVLFLHPADNNQLSLMESTCEQLNLFGIHTNRLEYGTYLFSSPKGDRTPWSCRVFNILRRIPKIRNRSIEYFRNNLVKFYSDIIQDYDILHIQSSFIRDFAEIAENAQKSGIKVIITIWGSDLNWETKEQRPWKDRIYRNSNIILLGPSSKGDKNVFKQKYPEYVNKVRRTLFGMSQLDVLDKMFADNTLMDISFLNEQAKNKLMITCGYNGREMQQHLLILDAIEKLPNETKQHLFLFLPMTYLLPDDYYKQVRDKLDKIGVAYQIQRERLSLSQNLSMRMMTDIVVNIQKTDGLAASLREHLYCGNILIAGDWLPYEIYTENDVFYIKTSLDSLYDNIKDVIDNYSDYKQRTIRNRINLYNISSWKAVLPQWKEIYEELLACNPTNCNLFI